MEADLDQPHISLEQDDSFMSNSTQEDGNIDFDSLLDEIEAIDDLEALEELENTLLSDKLSEAESLHKIHRRNAEVKDEINKLKSCIQELDNIHDEELQRIENLTEMIKVKQHEVLQQQDEQVDDLDRFELDVSEISKMFITAPREYKSESLNEKIFHLQNMLEESKNIKEREVEKVIEAQNAFKEPVEVQPMELPLSCLDDAITEVTSSIKHLDQQLNQITGEVKKLQYKQHYDQANQF